MNNLRGNKQDFRKGVAEHYRQLKLFTSALGLGKKELSFLVKYSDLT